MLAPIVIFTFNRLEHTKCMIDALKRNILSQDSDVFIFSDGGRNSKESVEVDKVRKYIRTIEGFRNITIIESSKNKGLAKSVIEGVTEILHKYKKVIVMEDDIITSKYFLTYMNDALNIYEERKDIWSISGYVHNMDFPKDYKEEVFLIKRGASWGWGTWEDRWITNDWYINDYNEFKKNKLARYKFNEAGEDLSFMLEDQMEGRIDSWAIRWVYNQFKKDMWTVYPVKSLVKNIGTDLSGTHSSNSNKYDVKLVDKEINLSKDVRVNKDICNNFKKIHDLKLSDYIAIVIKKIGLYKSARKLRNKISKSKIFN